MSTTTTAQRAPARISWPPLIWIGALHLVGADIVEVAPAYDHAQITGIAAAHVGYELLSAIAVRKGAG